MRIAIKGNGVKSGAEAYALTLSRAHTMRIARDSTKLTPPESLRELV